MAEPLDIWKVEGTRILFNWIVVDSSELEPTGLRKCELVGDKCWYAVVRYLPV